MGEARFTFVDLFCGVGGLTAALTALGGRCVYAFEPDPEAAFLYHRSWGREPVGEPTPGQAGAHRDVPAHDVLAARIPSQPFSPATAGRPAARTVGLPYTDVLGVVHQHRPSVVLLEEPPAIARRGPSRAFLLGGLRDAGYRVSDKPVVVSPHLLPPGFGGRPLARPRAYTTASRVPDGTLPLSAEPPACDLPASSWDPRRWDLLTDLPVVLDQRAPTDELSPVEEQAINAWDDLVQLLWQETGRPPQFDLRVDQFVPEDTVAAMLVSVPGRQSELALRNARFYAAHRHLVDDWVRRWNVDHLPARLRRLWWQAGDVPRLWDCVVYGAPGGLQATRPDYLTSLALWPPLRPPIVGPARRRLSTRESARLLGLPDWVDLGAGSQPTAQVLASASSVGAAYLVLKVHCRRDVDLLTGSAPGLLHAVVHAPDSPDQLIAAAPPTPSRVEERVAAAFQPARDKLEAVNRLSALTASGTETLGPGSKERKSVLVNLAQGLGISVDTSLPKPQLGNAIADALGVSWGQDCWSTGQTITLVGLNQLLRGAETRLASAATPPATLQEEASRIVRALDETAPAVWDGRTCIQEMLDAGDSQWAQDEWKGFYLEYLAGACTSLGGRRNALRYGRTTIDYLWVHPWDFKTHSDDRPTAILNDAAAFDACVADQGGLGFVVVSGRREVDPEFVAWQRAFREERGKSRRPTSKRPTQQRYGTARFTPTVFEAFYFDADNLSAAVEEKALRVAGIGHQTTSDLPRQPKYRLHLTNARPYLVAEIERSA